MYIGPISLWLRDVVPTVIIYVTKDSASSMVSSAPATTTSTLFLTALVGTQGPTNNPVLNLSPVYFTKDVSTVLALILALNPSNSANSVAATTTSVGASSAVSAKTSSVSISPSILSAGAAVTSPILSSDVSGSTRLGLAIGIPIAVICALGIVVFGLVFFKKRRLSAHLNNGMKAGFEVCSRGKPSIIGKDWKKNPENIHTYELGVSDSSKDSTATKTEPAVQKERPGLLSRLSRIITVPDSPLELRSPMFLRRFNLLSGERGVKSYNNGSSTNLSNKVLPQVPPVGYPYDSSGIPDDMAQHQDGTYSIIKPYVKRLGDELTVCVGETVKVVKFHSDGWATVKNIASSEVGVIPVMTLKKESLSRINEISK
ncbi:hypothetical protein PUMCH_001468 [Australozyma saopauloensis]|uniref:SH3 domain-containing protein n=1 Tax=Australozyma saopauloensis TaxID=291208 RepID=A0AAX4H6P2_9ASCO|nr:hypothetical protein PUMCH_001468 [[Candida] saopauloensis]